MGNTGIVLIVLAGVVLVGGVVYLRYKARKRKIAEFTAFAARRGWSYAQRDRSLVDRFVGEPFGQGHSRDAEHVLRGEHRGRQLMAFEYSYKETQGSGQDRRTVTYTHTVVALSTPAQRPTLQVGREGFGRKLLGFVGVRDLQLESEQFNETFHIKTSGGMPAEKFAYDVLHPRMMEWMLGDQRALSAPFRFERDDLLTWDRAKIELTKVQWMLDFLCDVLDRVPSFVWNS
jgi:hypothetical protein